MMVGKQKSVPSRQNSLISFHKCSCCFKVKWYYPALAEQILCVKNTKKTLHSIKIVWIQCRILCSRFFRQGWKYCSLLSCGILKHPMNIIHCVSCRNNWISIDKWFNQRRKLILARCLSSTMDSYFLGILTMASFQSIT